MSLKIGNVTLPSSVVYASLSGCSDYAYRRVVRKYHQGLIFCEMVKMEPLLRNHRNTLEYLEYAQGMRPLGAQLVGGKPELAGAAAKIIEDMGFDVVDLNCGCPVKKVVNDGGGSALLKDPELIGDIIANMVAAVRIPVTAKIRLGWDANSLCGEQVIKIVEEAGAKAVFVHGRTRAQGYTGRADYEGIKVCKEAARNIPVIGNGDIFAPEDALKMLEKTSCDGVLVARGTFGQPWLGADIDAALARKEVEEISFAERLQVLRDHFNYLLENKGEQKTIYEMRRVGCWYFKGVSGIRSYRTAMSRAESLKEIETLIESLA
ncbi:MAG: tRNA dihydrouridine synthase DusB [Chlamydiota bacterium]